LIAYWRDLWDRGLWWIQRLKRDEPPFRLYIGKRGRGKSLAMTRDVQKEMHKKRALVLSNYPVYDPYTDTNAIEWSTVEEMMNLVAQAVLDDRQRIIIAIDEAQNHFDARDWETCPRWFRTFLAESRHYHVGVIAATQSISQVDKRFRILCDEVVRVRPLLTKLHHRIAIFRMCKLDEDFDSVEEEAKEIGAAWFTYFTARVYGGYSTGALPTSQEMSKSDTRAIEALIARTREHVSTEGTTTSEAVVPDPE
jgi:hypothetical protein